MGLPALRQAISNLSKASLPEATNLRNQAAAIERYLKQSREAGQLQREVGIIRLRAEYRIGQLLRATVKKGRPNKMSPEGTNKLPLGITRNQSSRWQLIAAIPEPVFEKHLSTTKELTTLSLASLAKEHQREKRQTGPAVGGNVFTCDLAELPIDPASADLILTDPVYTDIQAYRRLAELSAAWLKPGALCLAYCNQLNLPDVLNAMGEHLQYHWLIVVRQKTKGRSFSRDFTPRYTPIAVFSNGRAARHPWLTDHLEGGGQDKALHVWQKPESEASYLIERLTEPGGLVVDPFAGSGTTLAAAKQLGRRWLGCDSDARSARIARRRVA